MFSRQSPDEKFATLLKSFSKVVYTFLADLGTYLATIFMGQAGLVSIGWRILLVIGAVAVIAGGIIRYMLLESPLLF